MHLTRVFDTKLVNWWNESSYTIVSRREEIHTHIHTIKLVKSKTPTEMRKLEEKLSSACCHQRWGVMDGNDDENISENWTTDGPEGNGMAHERMINLQRISQRRVQTLDREKKKKKQFDALKSNSNFLSVFHPKNLIAFFWHSLTRSVCNVVWSVLLCTYIHKYIQHNAVPLNW